MWDEASPRRSMATKSGQSPNRGQSPVLDGPSTGEAEPRLTSGRQSRWSGHSAEPLVGPFGRAADRCTKTPVSLGALISGFAAPDVRRGFAPPVDGHLRLGCALRSGYALVWAKGRTRGIAPIAFKPLRRGGASPHIGAAEPQTASHCANETNRLTSGRRSRKRLPSRRRS